MTIATSSEDFNRLAHAVGTVPNLEFAILTGSRASGSARHSSDWDIAILWRPASAGAGALGSLERLGRHESLRRALAQAITLDEGLIDLIDLAQAGLAMKAAVAEEGQVICINDELAWAHFQTRTWRELEDFYWDQAHAA